MASKPLYGLSKPVLSLGPLFYNALSSLGQPLSWGHVHMQTLQEAAELDQEGVPRGTRMFNICCPLLPSSIPHSQSRKIPPESQA